jgi:ankyrin repeat protein
LTAEKAQSLIVAMKLPALHAAAQTGTYAAVARLLAEGSDIDARSAGGETALMLAAARGRVDVMGLLIERGADVNAATDFGNTALMLAAARGQVDAVRALLERGARPDHRNKFGLGATDWAKWSERQPEVLALFGTAPA